jgi:hypothetical protein
LRFLGQRIVELVIYFNEPFFLPFQTLISIYKHKR